MFPDGSWGILISIAALIVSGATLWHTLSARPRVHAFVVRSYLAFGDAVHPDGDEVVITNLGRMSAVIYDVRALDGKGSHLKTKTMPRGYNQDDVPFPAMPQSLAPGGVLTAWFSTNLAGADAGRDHGYVVTYVDAGALPKGRTDPKELTVKATDGPPPEITR